MFYKLAPVSLSGIELGVLASPLKAAELLIGRIEVPLGIWVFRTERDLK